MNEPLTEERKEELFAVIYKMRMASHAFYYSAARIGNHPFIEFTGLMNECIQCCERALVAGIDFTQCNTHSGVSLPMAPFNVDYVNEKLECIFTGRSVVRHA